MIAPTYEAAIIAPVVNVVTDLLERPVYAMAQVDGILGLPSGTARRWIDGYRRSGRAYPPVVREDSTDEDTVTWGEFVETRLLAEYRDAGVPMIHMRPAIEVLRAELNTTYPLASARTWLGVHGKSSSARCKRGWASRSHWRSW